MPRTFASLVAVAVAVALATPLMACGTTLPNRDPVGEAFPGVSGTALTGDAATLAPEWFSEGSASLMLIGYVQDTQFDIDRWLLGLAQLGTPVRGLELPAIAGFWPGLFADRIDEGMRKGIPPEDWPAVVTVYDDADALLALTGNENPRNARVLLVDRSGTIRWFHDRGYSTGKLRELDALARELAAAQRTAP